MALGRRGHFRKWNDPGRSDCLWTLRILGRPFARWLLGPQQLDRGEQLFSRIGGWLVAVSRWQPILPELVACLAGMLRMRLSVFAAALTCGSVPLALAFAWVGHIGREMPTITLIISAIAPILLWAMLRPIVAIPKRH